MRKRKIKITKYLDWDESTINIENDYFFISIKKDMIEIESYEKAVVKIKTKKLLKLLKEIDGAK